MARDSRLRIGGWLAGGEPRHEPPRRYGDGRGPEPLRTPDGTGSGQDDGAPWSSEDAGWPLEDDGWPAESDGWPETVPGGLDRPDDPARSYRGRRRRRRPLGQVAAVAVVVGLVLLGTGVVANWAASSGEGSLGPPPRPDAGPIVPTPPDGDRPATPDPSAGGVSADPGGDAGRGEDRTSDRPSETAAGSSGKAPRPPGDGNGSPGRDDGVFEAEDGSLARGASIQELAAASGGRVVKLSPNASVELSGITVDRSGTYRLTVYYAATDGYGAQVSVNREPSMTVDFPALDRGVVGTVVLRVELTAGDNTVTVASPGQPGLMLDRISVTD